MKMLSLMTITGHAIWVNPRNVSTIERHDRGSVITMTDGHEVGATKDPSELAQEVGDRL